MYLCEYNTIFNQNQILLEAASQQPQIQPPLVNNSDSIVEFEPIKKYILYNKLNELKQRLHKSKLNKTNPTIQNIYGFIDLIIQFYNTFSYTDCKKLIERVSDMIIVANNIQVSAHRLTLDPELNQNKIQAQQAQQAQNELQSQEEEKAKKLKDHFDDIQKRNAELDLLSKRLDVGLKLHTISKSLKDNELVNKLVPNK